MNLGREKKSHLLPCKDSNLESGAFVTHTLDSNARGTIVSSHKNDYYDVLWSKIPETLDYKTYKSVETAIDNIMHKDFDIEASEVAACSDKKLNYIPLSHISKVVK